MGRKPSTPNNILPSRAVLIWYRWVTIVAEAFAGAAVFLLLVFWRRNEVPAVLDMPTWVYAAITVCLVGLTWLLGRDRWTGFFGLRHLPSHPPVWLASLLGTGIVFLAIFHVNELRGDLGIDREVASSLFRIGRVFVSAFAGVVALSVAALLFGLLKKLSNPKPKTSSGTPSTPTFSSFETLERWLLDDRAVTEASQDAFGFHTIAERIASRLAQPEPPAQAIVGKLGSGKTTLRHLVREALDRQHTPTRTQMVAVELWPYENAKAAVAGVMGALIESLSKEVSVISLRGLPAAYAEAMNAAGGFWSALVRLQDVPSNPFESLKAVDTLAKRIDRRYVVWIEDLERFAGEGETETVEQKLSPIRALLYGLDQLESVTVVTATTSLYVQFDIEKIARYVELLPELPKNDTRKIIAQLRAGCTENNGFIDPASPDVRKPLNELNEEINFNLLRSWLGPGVHDVTEALIALCRTPRVLKKALRACLDTWKRLAGEIDFDDVLALSILREAHQEAFSLIQDHLYFLRGGASRDERSTAEKKWTDALASMSADDETREATKRIVDFVFDSGRMNGNPQGVRNHNHVDYWERFLAVPRVLEEESDQPVLRALGGTDDEAIMRFLEDSKRFAYVEDFKRLLPTDRMLRMFIPLVTRRSMESAATWSDAHEPPGLVPLWRMLTMRGESGEVKPAAMWATLKEAYSIAVPKNLSLASDLEHYFVTASDNIHKLLEDRDGESYLVEAKAYLRKLLVDTFKDRDVELVRALDGAMSPTLLWLAWGLERVRANDMGGVPFEDWSELAPTILRAAELNRQVMLPQIATLITKEAVLRMGTVRYTYIDEKAKALFGDAGTVLSLFKEQNPEDWKEPHVLGVLAALNPVAVSELPNAEPEELD